MKTNASISLIAAIHKLAMAGEDAGFTLEQMIELLNSGLSVENLIELIAWRLNCNEDSLRSCFSLRWTN
jgi:hypothetical protein